MEKTDGELWAASNGQADKVKVIRHLLSTESRGERGLEERDTGKGGSRWCRQDLRGELSKKLKLLAAFITCCAPGV